MKPGGYDAAVELAECQRLVKGYSDTHERGLKNYGVVTDAVRRLADRADLAAIIKRLRTAALADEEGKQLRAALERAGAVFELTPMQHLAWPFFDDSHRASPPKSAPGRSGLCTATTTNRATRSTQHAGASSLTLGDAGFTRHCVPRAYGGTSDDFDARAICLVRETLAEYDGLADFAFAMQGLGSGAISIAGSDALRARYLPAVAAGRAIAAFALSEPEAGSDVAAMQCSARRDGDHYVLDGAKTWISNGGIADFYCVFARTTPGQKRADGTTGAQGITAFVVDADAPGFEIEQRIDVIAPHPLATLRFRNCRVSAGAADRRGR